MKPPLSLEAFADWAEKQPSTECYDYDSPSRCATAQYLQSLGFEDVKLGHIMWSATGTGLRYLPEGFMMAARYGIQTFGELAKRLRTVAARP